MSFIGKFFLLVLAMGFGELYLLVKVSASLTFPVTLGICVLTGVLGGALVRHQGLKALSEIQGSLGRNEVPAEALVSGLVLLLVGVVLILPGFITDTVGFLLLIPPLRRQTARWLVDRFKGRISTAHTVHFDVGGWTGEGGVSDEHRYRQVIDVDPEPPRKDKGPLM
jgi:UPF0716 protein FxsA